MRHGPAVLSALTIALALACQPVARDAAEAGPRVSPYLYAWAGAEREGDSDFLAVIDADPSSERYARIVASVPVGLRGMAHHTEHVMPRGDTLFVNAFRAGTTFLIDVSDPLHPAVAGSSDAQGEFTYPHTYERLPNGNVLATFQTRGEATGRPAGWSSSTPRARSCAARGPRTRWTPSSGPTARLRFPPSTGSSAPRQT